MWHHRRAGFSALCFAGLALNAVTLGPALSYTAAGTTDFKMLYAGSKLAFTGDLYTVARMMETEQRTEGSSSTTRLYLRLPCFALFLRPLASLPYVAASALWEALCVLAAIAFAMIWPVGRRSQTALVCCWSLPLFMTIAEGQDIGFLLLWIAVAAVLVQRGRPVAGGTVASLCLSKFHLFLTIPLWIVARRQWKFAGGLIAGSSVLIAVSFIPGGWNWPQKYVALLRQPSTNPFHDVMPNIYAVLGGLPHAGALEIAGAGAIALAVWTASRAGGGPGLAAALIGGVLVTPHAYMADCALLIPAILTLNGEAMLPWMRALCLFLLTPFPWVLLTMRMALPGILAMFALLMSLAGMAIVQRAGGLLAVSVPDGRNCPSGT